MINIPHYKYLLQPRPQVKTSNIMYIQIDENHHVTSCVNWYSFKDNIIDLGGYAFLNDVESGQLDYKLLFANDKELYRYDIVKNKRQDVAEAYNHNLYQKSGFKFTQYLYDMNQGEYWLILEISYKGNKIYEDLHYTMQID